MKKYSLLQRIQIAWGGKVFIEHRKMEKWTGYLPFYAHKCAIHGIVENYPHGYSARLICPKCVDSKDEQ